MSGHRVLYIVWLLANTFLYSLALLRCADTPEYVALFAFSLTSVLGIRNYV